MEPKVITVVELRRVFDQYAAAADVLDAKALGILLVASVIVHGVAGQAPLLLVYFALVAFCLNVIRPRKYKNAIATNWNDLDNNFWQREEAAYDVLISTYLASIDFNKSINNEKARCLRVAMVLFIVFIAGVVVSLIL